ncbi:MAG: hypothetical protein QNJ35_03430 [Paracoccaceae bacterium]|nr:hypothetical protein [Paracoccaceae bacterium]
MSHRWGLDLSMTAVRLMRREAGHWEEAGSEATEGDDLDKRLRKMVKKAEKGAALHIFLPQDHILYTSVQLGSGGNAQDELLKAMEDRTPYALDEMQIDWELGPDGDARVAAVARKTLDEAEVFVKDLGFDIAEFSALATNDQFPRNPDFGGGAASEDGSITDAPAFATARTDTPDAKKEPSETKESPVESDKPVVMVEDSAPVMQLPEPELAPLDPGPALPRASSPPRVTTDVSAPMREIGAAGTLAPRPKPAPKPSAKAPLVSLAAFAVAALLSIGIAAIVWSILPEAPSSGRADGVETPASAPESATILPDIPAPQAMTADPALNALGEGADTAEVGLSALGAPTQTAAAPAALTAPSAQLAALPGLPAPLPAAPADLPGSPVALTAPQELAATPPAPWTDAVATVIELVALPGTDEIAETLPATDPVPPTPMVAALPPAEDVTEDAPVPPIETTEAHVAEAPAETAEAPVETEAPIVTALPEPATTELEAPPDAAEATVAEAPETAVTEPEKTVAEASPEPSILPSPTELAANLPDVAPRARPGGFEEAAERQTYGGRTLDELERIRAAPRPESAQRVAEAERADQTPTDLAVGTSLAPTGRPSDIDSIVAVARTRAREAQERARVASIDTSGAVRAALTDSERAEAADEAQAQAVTAPRNSPRLAIPSEANVARQATIDDAIRLNRINLVGVFGVPSDRRALVRLPSGRYLRVKRGDRVDGGTVEAITDSTLQYRKGGRVFSLEIPSG